MTERDVVDGRRDNHAVGVTLGHNSRDDFHPVHEPAAHQVVQCVGVVGQHQLGHAECRIRRRFLDSCHGMMLQRLRPESRENEPVWAGVHVAY